MKKFLLMLFFVTTFVSLSFSQNVIYLPNDIAVENIKMELTDNGQVSAAYQAGALGSDTYVTRKVLNSYLHALKTEVNSSATVNSVMSVFEQGGRVEANKLTSARNVLESIVTKSE